MTAASQNYEVTAKSFGPYITGNVIPDYETFRAGNIGPLIEAGVLKPTTAAVNVQILPVPKAEDAGSATVTATMLENNSLRADVLRLDAMNKDLETRLAEQTRHTSAFRDECAIKVTEIDRLRQLVTAEQSGRTAAEEKNKALGDELATARKDLEECKLALAARSTEPKVEPPAGETPPATQRTE